MLLNIGGEHIGHTRVKARTEQGHQTLFGKAVLIGPLPVIFEFGFVARLIIGGVEIMHAGFKTGIHNRQILIRQRQIDHQLRLHFIDKRHCLGHIIGI